MEDYELIDVMDRETLKGPSNNSQKLYKLEDIIWATHQGEEDDVVAVPYVYNYNYKRCKNLLTDEISEAQPDGDQDTNIIKSNFEEKYGKECVLCTSCFATTFMFNHFPKTIDTLEIRTIALKSSDHALDCLLRQKVSRDSICNIAHDVEIGLKKHIKENKKNEAARLRARELDGRDF